MCFLDCVSALLTREAREYLWRRILDTISDNALFVACRNKAIEIRVLQTMDDAAILLSLNDRRKSRLRTF